eukprot:TRINITY_DN3253_c1_g1_i2.p1 TRINITY_DN3253_c1_g1~~TRINITY_DN3253_c1_g1_i2.p1  ORF type:complete len:2404 (+),score=519.61 TRINITY_DN3253_c1_g1_i2:42-7253(+)
MIITYNLVTNTEPQTLDNFAKEFRRYVENTARDLKGEDNSTFLHDIYESIRTKLHSNNLLDKYSGLMAIDSLIESPCGESSSKIPRFFTFLRPLLLSSNDFNFTLKLSKVLGHLASSGETIVSEYLDHEITRSLEVLETDMRNEMAIVGAISILRELSYSSPAVFCGFFDRFIDSIWIGIQDSREYIRRLAVDALCTSLNLLTSRDPIYQQQKLFDIYNVMITLLESNNSVRIHGGLMVVDALLKHNSEFLIPRFQGLLTQIIRFLDSRDVLIRSQSIILIGDFSFHLNEMMIEFLETIIKLVLIKDVKYRLLIIQALSKMCLGIKSNMIKYLDGILEMFNKTFVDLQKKKINIDEEELLLSLKDVVTGMSYASNNREKLFHKFVSMAFQFPLSEALSLLLLEIVKLSPNKLPDVQTKLLNQISLVLSNSLYVNESSSSFEIEFQKYNGNFNSIFSTVTQKPEQMANKKNFSFVEILNALRCFYTFNFQNFNLASFIRRAVSSYFDSVDEKIRLQSALVAIKFLSPQITSDNKGSSSRRNSNDKLVMNAPSSGKYRSTMLFSLIMHLTIMAVSDPSQEVRLAIISSLDERYDEFMIQAEVLETLLLGLKDEIFEIRLRTIELLGRLSLKNPAMIVSTLRQVLIQLLMQLSYAIDSRVKEESCKLISTIIRSCNHLIKPYTYNLIGNLQPKLKLEDSQVITAVLEMISELISVSDFSSMQNSKFKLFKTVLPIIYDQTSVPKKSAAFKLLAKLVQQGGFPIKPYNEEPTLLKTLISELGSEQSTALKIDISNLIGVIGALDPFQYKLLGTSKFKYGKEEDEEDDDEDDEVFFENDELENEKDRIFGKENLTENEKANDVVELSAPENIEEETGEIDLDPMSPLFYCGLVISEMIAILNDTSLQHYYQLAHHCAIYIFNFLVDQDNVFLPHFLPVLLKQIVINDMHQREFLFAQLVKLIDAVGPRISPFVAQICDLSMNYWSYQNPSISIKIVDVIESISNVLSNQFRVHVPYIIPHFMDAVKKDQTPGKILVRRIVQSFRKLSHCLSEYLFLIIPLLIQLIENSEIPNDVKGYSIDTISHLALKVDLSPYVSAIILPLIRIIENSNSISNTDFGTASDVNNSGDEAFVLQKALEAFQVLNMVLKHKLSIFSRNLHLLLKSHNKNLDSPEFSQLITDIVTGTSNNNFHFEDINQIPQTPRQYPERFAFEPRLMLAALDFPITSQNDWNSWLRMMINTLLKYNPSPALRATATLAEVYEPLALRLFNAAFASVWASLSNTYQDEFIRIINNALNSKSIPRHILQTLLNLAEFMEHKNNVLPLDIRVLGNLSYKCNLYAKALHYKEIEFETNPYLNFEELININNRLRLNDATIGILLYVQKIWNNERNGNLTLNEVWYEKLDRHDIALSLYEAESESTFKTLVGKARCMNRLGKWKEQVNLVKDSWENLDEKSKQSLAGSVCDSCFKLKDWENLNKFSQVFDQNSIEGKFYSALEAIENDKYEKGLLCIKECREILSHQISSLARESYHRCYDSIVSLQQLCELEEIIQLKENPSVENEKHFFKLWTRRFKGTARDPNVRLNLLAIRNIAIPIEDDLNIRLQYVRLCEKKKSFSLAEAILRQLMERLPDHPEVEFAWLTHRWKVEDLANKGIICEDLEKFVRSIENSFLIQDDDNFNQISMNVNSEPHQIQAHDKLRSRAHLTLGKWKLFLKNEEMSDIIISNALLQFRQAIKLNEQNYSAHHELGILLYNMSQRNIDSEQKKVLIPEAMESFIEAIVLNGSQQLQDLLRLLQLWFNFGNHRELSDQLRVICTWGFDRIASKVWLQVLPQMIARLSSAEHDVLIQLEDRLKKIGTLHPQSLIYPLTVAASEGQPIAARVLSSMKEHSPKLVSDGNIVIHELIRIAILWSEQWVHVLDEAGHYFINQRDYLGMVNVIQPLHDLINNGPETPNENSFYQQYAGMLKDAGDNLQSFMETRNTSVLQQAWDKYCQIYDRLARNPPSGVLNLAHVSPKLLKFNTNALCIPTFSTYAGKLPFIRGFATNLNILSSKRHPRKLIIKGSDGQSYQYLLKAHEDLRQDERAMQFLDFVNKLCEQDVSNRFHNGIEAVRRYSATPISNNVGLVGWVPSSNTLSDIIRSYRTTVHMGDDQERNIIRTRCKTYDNLTLVQKAEVFHYVNSVTTGNDLARNMWLKSPSSEVWLEHRTTYSRSLAITSIVGYILGLGDRHPANLMLDKHTGQIFHCDYGDCFEVAMLRSRYPEKVPFRLTRMLIQALEVSGIEGTFRCTGEMVLGLIREERETMMALLETFIYDPLINWRFVQTDDDMREMFEQDHGYNSLRLSVFSHYNDADFNAKALEAIKRIDQKLSGKDFPHYGTVDVPMQFEHLITEATDPENLCQMYSGWCAWW